MAFERLTADARAAVLAASEDEARAEGSATIEAEHLLLALAAHPSLEHLGLDRAEIAGALAREEERSLAAVGVAPGDYGSPTPTGRPRKPKLATSFKVALHRAVTTAQVCGDRRIGAHHLLGGVLAAEHGRVPRALRIAGIDVAELRTRL
jgi:ATP-dependent Clp protease ATP-binding subunit ClpA